MTNPLTSKTWTFLCGRWLDKGEDDGKIERELVPSNDADISQPCMLTPLCALCPEVLKSCAIKQCALGALQTVPELLLDSY